MPRSPAQRLNSTSAILGVAAGAVMISFSSVFVKLAQVGPSTSGFYRMLFGALALTLTALLFRQRLRIDRKVLFWTALAGLIFAADLTVWHRSIVAIGPGLATVLANFQVFVMIGAGVLFLREAVTLNTLGAVVLALTGLGLLVGPGWGELSDQWRAGVLFGLATALFYSAYIVILRKLHSGRGQRGQVWIITLVAAWCALFMAAEVPLAGETFVIPDGNSLLSLLAYGILCQALGWFLIARSLPRVDLSITGITILLQPALAFGWDMMLFSRPTTLLDLIGATMTLVAIYIGVTRQRRVRSVPAQGHADDSGKAD